MRGHNVNIYFSEEAYNKIKPLIKQRKVSQFVSELVVKELEKERERLKKRLIMAHQRVAKNKKLQKELSIWDETIDDYIKQK